MLEGLKRNLESVDFFFTTFLPLFAWKERAVLVQVEKVMLFYWRKLARDMILRRCFWCGMQGVQTFLQVLLSGHEHVDKANKLPVSQGQEEEADDYNQGSTVPVSTSFPKAMWDQRINLRLSIQSPDQTSYPIAAVNPILDIQVPFQGSDLLQLHELILASSCLSPSSLMPGQAAAEGGDVNVNGIIYLKDTQISKIDD